MNLKSPIFFSARRIFRNTLINISRNKFLSIATVTLMALIIFIFNIILAIDNAAKSAIKTLHGKVDIIVYIDDEADFIEIDNLIEDLRAFPEIRDVKFTSKEKALEEILAAFPEQGNPFQKYGIENKLPANIQIITQSPKSHPPIISFLYEGKYSNLLKNVENNQENQMMAEKLVAITDATQKVLFGVVISFFIGGFLIIINGISLTIHSRRKEIHIMKLVGASYSYIKTPFILEGLIYGLLAAIFGIILLNIFLLNINIGNLGLELKFASQAKFLILEMLAGMAMGIIASSIATEKYLHRMQE